jgi:hypothetical protein
LLTLGVAHFVAISHVLTQRLQQLVASNVAVIEARMNATRNRMGSPARDSLKPLPAVLLKDEPCRRWTAVYKPLIRLYVLFPVVLALLSDREFPEIWSNSRYRNEEVPLRADTESLLADLWSPCIC